MSPVDFNVMRELWQFIPKILSILGLGLSVWIVIPPVTFPLLVLTVATLELSPWLIVINGIALWGLIAIERGIWSNLLLVGSLLGLSLAYLPLSQFTATNEHFAASMTEVLGDNYLELLPNLQTSLRSQPLAILDVFRGIAIPEIRCDRGIVFADPDGVELKLNVYRPLTVGSNPTLIIIYGGAWRSGSPDGYEQFSSYIAAQGYTIITIDYRHAPRYQFPNQLEDVKTALNYIQAHAEELEVDLERVGIMGRSAGGHLATLLAYQPEAFPFKAVVSYYSPVNLTRGYYEPPVPNPLNTTTLLEDFMGGTPAEKAELYQQASPINYVRPNLPPSLLVYAGCDRAVQPQFGQLLSEKLKAQDNSVIFLEIPWAEHAFDTLFSGVSNQLALYYTERFLASTLQAKS